MICHRNSKGQLHNLDGPAIEYGSGHKEYWVNGKLHSKYRVEKIRFF